MEWTEHYELGVPEMIITFFSGNNRGTGKTYKFSKILQKIHGVVCPIVYKHKMQSKYKFKWLYRHTDGRFRNP